MENPLNNVIWLHRDTIKPNPYNPNRVAAPELRLLKISILEDGWTQPIVLNSSDEIVDGFHRWSVSADPEVMDRDKGLVPTVRIAPKDNASQQMSTIRHNRARGTHGVLDMSRIVSDMVKAKISMQEIMYRLQMEREEVLRLTQRSGIPQSAIIQDSDFSQAWEV
jgi:ParB-like chromosome segregation protein Spo0J